MNRSVLTRNAFAILIAWAACATALADPPPMMEPTPNEPQVDVRQDGVLAESYGYHRQASRPATYPPPGGWYGYGFPVTTYRWGWFGAERYYPRVTWHRDDDGDCVRWAYRDGY